MRENFYNTLYKQSSFTIKYICIYADGAVKFNVILIFDFSIDEKYRLYYITICMKRLSEERKRKFELSFVFFTTKLYTIKTFNNKRLKCKFKQNQLNRK